MSKLTFAFFLLLTACATTTPTIYQRNDQFSGDMDYFTTERNGDLEGGSFWSGRYVTFSFHAYKVDTAAIYRLNVTSVTPQWVFIKDGESLVLKLDNGDYLKFTKSGESSRSVLTGSAVFESASFSITLDQIRQIGAAKKVEFRIYGGEQIITGSWDNSLIADATLFADQAPNLVGSNKQAQTKPLRLGVQYVLVTQPIAESLRIPSEKGIIITNVLPGSVAEHAGLKPGDVVLKLGDKTITTLEDLPASIETIKPGTKSSMILWRNGLESTIDIEF